MVPGGFDVTSYTTRLPRPTALTLRAGWPEPEGRYFTASINSMSFFSKRLTSVSRVS